MDSAATTSGPYQDISTTDGYAIPINRALAIAKQIVSGKASATVHIGATAFLGISTAPKQYDTGQQGAVVATVVPGSAADTAGLKPGDLITAIDGTKITSSAAVCPNHHVEEAGHDADGRLCRFDGDRPDRSHQAWQRAAPMRRRQPLAGREAQRAAWAFPHGASCMTLEFARDRRRVDDRVTPVVERDALRKELRTEAVPLAGNRVQAKRDRRRCHCPTPTGSTHSYGRPQPPCRT